MSPSIQLGLEILHTPSGNNPSLDIVLVHGLAGSSRGTWTHNGSGLFWPLTLTQSSGLRKCEDHDLWV